MPVFTNIAAYKFASLRDYYEAYTEREDAERIVRRSSR